MDDEERSPLSEVVNVVKNAIPGVDAYNARRREQYDARRRELEPEVQLSPFVPVEEQVFNDITEVGDAVTRSGKWNGRLFNEITCDSPDWFKRVARYVLHDGYVYASWVR